MGLKCGIVGLPNVGKSTLFNALTQATVEAKNYPFCTIDPHIGLAAVPDPRLQQLATLVKSNNIIPAHVEFVDIAGLVKGASKGDGLGNKFLANIREAHALLHVVRCFSDDNIIHVSGKVDPVADIEVINTELCLADQETLERAITKLKKPNQSKTEHQQLLETLIQKLDQGTPVHAMHLSTDEQAQIKELQLLTQKPVLYIANVAEGQQDSNLLKELQHYIDQNHAQSIMLCVSSEAEIAQLEDDEKQDYLDALGMQESGLDQIIRAAYKLLGLQNYFTASAKEVRAWIIPVNTPAAQAAGVIHTDFERGFIRAEVVAFNDYMEHQHEKEIKDAGKWRLEGKDYIVADGDVIRFRFNV